MAHSINKITPPEEKYPLLLKEIPGRPEELFYIGRLPDKNDFTIAIVGTRKASQDGLLTAKNIAYELAQKGITIVSGLALGIDAAAHEGALAASGKTVAVLANGLPNFYPPQHHNLAEKIISQNGCIISEYPEGTPAYPSQFLERNRIISGLSYATVVIEAPIRSGSLTTVKHALDQGREVFVVPGKANHPNYRGSHMLIRNGGRLVTSADEIIEDLGTVFESLPDIKIQSESPIGKTEEEKIIINLLKAEGRLTIDKIIELTKLEPQIVHQTIAFLSLDDMIEEKAGECRLK